MLQGFQKELFRFGTLEPLELMKSLELMKPLELMEQLRLFCFGLTFHFLYNTTTFTFELFPVKCFKILFLAINPKFTTEKKDFSRFCTLNKELLLRFVIHSKVKPVDSC